MKKIKSFYPYESGNINLSLLGARLGSADFPRYSLDTVDGANDMAKRLKTSGGFAQQNRMIRDKQRSLDKATLYSYQAARVKKYAQNNVEDNEEPVVRALINPDKTKMDYDDKIISIQFEHGYQPGDVFEWCQTNTYWLIYLQDLTELAYLRAEIRRCTQEISWQDEDGIHSTFAAVRGPVETKIDYIQKHDISIDNPNYSLHIYMPKTDEALEYFQRYSKFYLNKADKISKNICWRVETVDSISTPNIIELTAVEYYANEIEDDIENGLVGALKVEVVDPTPVPSKAIIFITGDTFIKPKKEYVYSVGGKVRGTWNVTKDRPVTIEPFTDEKGFPAVKVKWNSTYSGQFELSYGNYNKTIVVESLF